MPGPIRGQREDISRDGRRAIVVPGLPQVGGIELLILLAIVLLFFGAKRIPDLARSLGKGTREFRKGISEGASEDEAREEGDDRLKEKGREEEPFPKAETAEGASGREAKTTHPEQKS